MKLIRFAGETEHPEHIQVFLTLPDYELTVEQVWPAGDAPEVITSEAVLAVISEWDPLDLYDEQDLTIDVNVYLEHRSRSAKDS